MTSESGHKFTSGPWEVRKAKQMQDGAFDYAIGADVGGRVQCIAEAFGRSSEFDFLPADANATLIAAAPELLEAAMQAFFEAEKNDRQIWKDTFIKLRAAISKALGETS